jgi:iron-sulfur cluster repair protein YtfE (RIC family)
MRCHKDHEEIGRALAEFLDALRSRACASLGGRFSRFWMLLDEHMTWEERCLFPALEQRTPGFLDGPGRALRDDHDTIRRFAGIVARQLRRCPLPLDGLTRIAEATAALETALREHDRTEAIQLLTRRADGASGLLES